MILKINHLEIQKDVAPNLMSYRMDSQTLPAMKKYEISYSQAYRNQLLKAVEMSEFLQFQNSFRRCWRLD